MTPVKEAITISEAIQEADAVDKLSRQACLFCSSSSLSTLLIVKLGPRFSRPSSHLGPTSLSIRIVA